MATNDQIQQALKKALRGTTNAVTVADASTKSGLSLHDAKSGLHELVAEYRGTLAATSQGELLYSFPTGFTKPWQQQEALSRFWAKFKKFGLGILKFLVRSWITVVMVAYVVIFALILIALMFGKSSDRDEGHSLSGQLMFHMLFRMVLDSLFWTFHPFSPFRVTHDDYYDRHPRQKQRMPFYEKVNRFFFGPEEQPVTEEALVKLALQEIRAQKGRIGLVDLMRVTGLSKEEADPFMAKLMLNHEGDVIVSDEGGIVYEFPAMRKTALMETTSSPPPIWHRREVMLPFTGNEVGSNILIAGLNGFNLVMSLVAISNSWTIEKLKYIFYVSSANLPPHLIPPPPEGTPLLLGWIPLIFSSALFMIPVIRGLFRNQKKREIDAKNGKRGLIRAILSKLSLRGIKEDVLRQGWKDLARVEPNDRELTREIVKLGGEIELSETTTGPTYHFPAIEAEMTALEKARARADRNEAVVGEVIFSSAK